MRDALGPATVLGYCTNVHAGSTLAETRDNLETHALAVKAIVSPREPMGIGLWLSAQAARELVQPDAIHALRDWLGEHGLEVFTLNGFPYGDFHEPVVKERVYLPHWLEDERAAYTARLMYILATLAGPSTERSISTLPIGWRGDLPNWRHHARLCSHLLDLVVGMKRLEQDTGCLVHLDIEPEPGCCLQRAEDVVYLFDRMHTEARLRRGYVGDRLDEAIQRHLRVCHDICHAAVMFEAQEQAFERYRAADIRIGKVQVSNAIRLATPDSDEDAYAEALAQLRGFAEDRYLHQTVIDNGQRHVFFTDLPDALAASDIEVSARGEWRIHFHVPVYLESFGLLTTTREHIAECVRLLQEDDVRHWEVETYAWNVLPAELQRPTLAEGIAEELTWFRDLAACKAARE